MAIKARHLITAKKAYEIIGCDSRHFNRVYKKHLNEYFEEGGVKARYCFDEVNKLDKKIPYLKAAKHQQAI